MLLNLSAWRHFSKSTVFQGLLSVAISFSLLEITLAFFVYTPSIQRVLPVPIRNAMEYLYNERTARHISLMPQCSRYDADTFYVLKPSMTCRYANIEYDTKITSNSMGLRDSEKNLKAPKVIALGDSFTFGVGVEAGQTFVSQLENITGKQILNAGMSSFGTERELRMLRRLDKSQLQAVIVQYSNNDRGENASAIKPDGLNIRSKKNYRRISQKHVRKTKYLPFKLSFYLIRDVIIRQALRPGSRDNSGTDEEVAHFVQLLERMRKMAPGVRFIVTELNGRGSARSEFLAGVALRYKDDHGVVVVPVEQSLPVDAYFAIDNHVNAKGHNLIAKRLAPYLLRKSGP